MYLLVLGLVLVLALLFSACSKKDVVLDNSDTGTGLQEEAKEMQESDEKELNAHELEDNVSESDQSTADTNEVNPISNDGLNDAKTESGDETLINVDTGFSIEDYLLSADDFAKMDYSTYFDGNYKLFLQVPNHESLGRLRIESKKDSQVVEEIIFDNEFNIYKKDANIANLKWNDYFISDPDKVIDSIIKYGDKQHYIVEMLNKNYESYYGVIDYKGNWLVEPLYKQLEGLDVNGVGLGLKGRSWYAVSIDGTELAKIETKQNTVTYIPLGTFARISGNYYFLNEASKRLLNEEILNKLFESGDYVITRKGEFYEMKDYTKYPETEIYILDKYLNIIDSRKIQPTDRVMINRDGKIDKVFSDTDYKRLLNGGTEIEHNGAVYKSLEIDPETMDNAVFFNKQFWQKKDSWNYYILVTDLNGNVLLDENTKYLTIDYRSSLKDKRFAGATVYADNYTPPKNFERVIFDLKELKAMNIKTFLECITEKVNLNLDEFILHNSDNGELADVLVYLPY